MKKNDLIRLLQNIKGNPEIMVWNGFVQDVMPLGELLEVHLYKEKPEVTLKYLNLEELQEGKELTKDLKDVKHIRRSWELDLYGYKNPKYHNKKKIITLVPRTQGKKSWGRDGTIEY